jgi:hypothetical protein
MAGRLSLGLPDQFETHVIDHRISPSRQSRIDRVLTRLMLCHFSYTDAYSAATSLPRHESIVINRFECIVVDIFVVTVDGSFSLVQCQIRPKFLPRANVTSGMRYEERLPGFQTRQSARYECRCVVREGCEGPRAGARKCQYCSCDL